MYVEGLSFAVELFPQQWFSVATPQPPMNGIPEIRHMAEADFYRAALYAGRSFLRASVRLSARPSIRPSVCQTREL